MNISYITLYEHFIYNIKLSSNDKTTDYEFKYIVMLMWRMRASTPYEHKSSQILTFPLSYSPFLSLNIT